MHRCINTSEERCHVIDPTIDVENGVPPGVAAFYDWLAPEYNTMTGFAKLFAHEKPFFRMLVERHGIRTAVDAGCGTGFHSLLLAQLGVSVTAVDVSADMLADVQRHAGDLPIHPLRSSFRDLPSAVKHPVDAVFCMGNSLAHLLSTDDLGQSLAAFAAVLRPGGILFAQNLNFERILAVRECIQSIREADGVTFVRFYDYEGDLIRFSILRVSEDPRHPPLAQLRTHRPDTEERIGSTTFPRGFWRCEGVRRNHHGGVQSGYVA